MIKISLFIEYLPSYTVQCIQVGKNYSRTLSKNTSNISTGRLKTRDARPDIARLDAGDHIARVNIVRLVSVFE